MKTKVTPQEKKIRDYLNQSGNCFGRNDKTSRKAIRINKAKVLRAFRRNVNNCLSNDTKDWDEVESDINSVKRLNWRKFPDKCLLKSFKHKWSGSSRTEYLIFEKRHLQREAEKRLRKIKTRPY